MTAGTALPWSRSPSWAPGPRDRGGTCRAGWAQGGGQPALTIPAPPPNPSVHPLSDTKPPSSVTEAFILPRVAPSSPASSSPSPKSLSPHVLKLPWCCRGDTVGSCPFSARRGQGQPSQGWKGTLTPTLPGVTSGQGMGWTARDTPDPADVPGELSRQSVPWLLFQAKGRIGIGSHPLVPGLWLHQPRGD